MKIMITGGCGFIASFLVDHVLKTTDWDIVILSKSESKHGTMRLKDIGALDNPRVEIIRCDMSSGIPPIPDVDYIAHLGAESHVTTSISEPEMFIRSNVMGTFRVLEYARSLKGLKKFLYFSTDEVYGPAAEGETFTEWSRYNSTNPYAATKAAAEELCLAWENTYGVPVVITHCMNVIGERQHPEKLVPLVINRALSGRAITVHTVNGKPATRSFIHGSDVAKAVMLVLDKGKIREKYNIPGAVEVSIADLTGLIINIIAPKHPVEVILASPDDRPGVDMRYSVGGDNLEKLGFKSEGVNLRPIVQWYVDHAKEWYA